MKCLAVLMLINMTLFLSSIQATDTSHLRKELKLAEIQVMDASIRTDSLGIQLARSRFERLLKKEAFQKDAELASFSHYYIGFADFQLFWSIPEIMKNGNTLLPRVIKNLDKALELKPDLVDAHVISALSYFFLSFLDRPNYQQYSSKMNAAVEKAEAISPDNPHIAFFKSLQASFSGRRDLSINYAQSAINTFENETDNQRWLADWWQVWPYAFLAGFYINEGNRDQAKEIIDKVLSLRPDFEYLVVNRMPAVELQRPIATRNFKNVNWTQLANDPKGDGKPELPDARALYYFYDQKNDSLWFKIDVYEMPELNGFGLNLVVDVDENPQNGSFWWGGNNKFRYDKLVSVWVTHAGSGYYSGFVGICTDFHARKTWFLKLGSNNITFGIDHESKSFIFGFKRTDLDESKKLNIIAAVGSNVNWNDDIVDSGSIKLELR